jgi:putative FmdB family regulatory protein
LRIFIDLQEVLAMPIYEYECTRCGATDEVFQKLADKPLQKCKHCNGKLHKLISQSSFHLKGTGWYVTDYANKSGPKTVNQKNVEKKSSEKPDTSVKAADSST